MFAALYAPSSAQAKLLALAGSFSPLVEDTTRGLVIFSLVGLGRLMGPLDQVVQVITRTAADAGIHGNLAVSVDPDTAALLARQAGGITMVAPGREAEKLAELPLTVLPMTPQMLDTLERWGIRTLGEMAELPELGFVARFGEEGTRMLRLARGETRRVLRAVAAPEDYERRQDLDYPERLLEPLLFVLSSLLNELTAALARQGLATNCVHLGLSLDWVKDEKRQEHHRTLEFPVPVREPQVILKQLQMDLEAHPPIAAILGLCVRLDPVQPRALQHGLFIPQAPAPEKLQLTVTRLKALMGEGSVGSPQLLNSHRPDAYVMRAFLPETPRAVNGSDSPLQQPVHSAALRFAFRYWRPASAAQVRMHAERPVQVDASAARHRMRAVRGEVLAVAGPWRASGNWWEQAAWQREEWDVELSNGGVYRLFHTLNGPSRQWFVEGMYD